MICAKCKGARLGRLRVAGSLGAWTCPSCEGIWIPSGHAIGAQVPDALPSDVAVTGDADSRAGLCPEGHGILTRAQTHLDDGFYLERCSECSGVWFDKGEWQRVAAAGLAGGLFEIWTEPWQREQWQSKAAESYSAQLQSELGGELVTKLSDLAGELRGHPSRSLAVAFLLRELSVVDARSGGVSAKANRNFGRISSA